MKKAFAVLMLLAMVLSFGAVSAFAAEQGTITIDSKSSGKFYAYKIFDLTTSKNNSGAIDGWSYTIDSATSKWFDDVLGFMGATKKTSPLAEKYTGKGLTLTLVPGSTVYNVTNNNDFSAPEFAAYLRTKVANGTYPNESFDITNHTPYVKLTPDVPSTVDHGYWFVATDTGSIANLTSNAPDVKIHNKNPIFDKQEEVNGKTYNYSKNYGTSNPDIVPTVQIGDVITYTYPGESIPDCTGYDFRFYKYKDTMSAGLTFNQDVNVKIDGKDISIATDRTKTTDELNALCACGDNVSDAVHNGTAQTPGQQSVIYYPTDAPNTFYLYLNVNSKETGPVFPDNGGHYQYNMPISITYSATVNAEAAGKVEKNEVTRIDNNPQKSPCANPHTDNEYNFSTNIKINKVDGKDKTKTLEGAQFVLLREVTGSGNKIEEFYKFTAKDTSVSGSKDQVTWYRLAANESIDDAIKAGKITVAETNANGVAEEFKGLMDGSYKLREIKAPDGYNLMDTDVTVTIDKIEDAKDKIIAGTIHSSTDVLEVKAEVENEKGPKLPDTGGIGTTIFYVVGGLLVFGAVVLLVSKKIFNTQENQGK